MNRVKFIVLILAALFSTIFAHTYIASDPGDGADYDSLAAGVTLPAGHIALPTDDGLTMFAVDCYAASLIKASLEADTSVSGVSGGLKAGSCCINAHHVVCQKMQDAIRSCEHSGKGDDSTSDQASICPQ